MHKYFETIGFTKYISREQLAAMLMNLLKHQDSMNSKVYVSKEGIKYAEMKTYYGDNFGIIWNGYMTEKDSFVLEYVVPFVDGYEYIPSEHPSIERKKETTSFVGMCDDIRIGISIIFQVINTNDCLEQIGKGEAMAKPVVSFGALSDSGSILFPISKEAKENDTKNSRYELINAAKSGDEKAIETLTLEDLDTYTKLSKRIQHEDVFTIVDSSFMPFGLECDLYMIIGDIFSVEKTLNVVTKEKIYILGINCNDFKINVAINAKTLVGQPMVGRRFKGNIWLQGEIKDKDCLSQNEN